MELQRLISATLIAILRRQTPPILIENQIWEGWRIAKKLAADEALSETTYEWAVAELNIKTSSSTYQDLANWEVPKGRTGILSQVEIACADYTNARFKLLISEKELWKDKQLPDSTTLLFPDVVIKGGKSVILQGKSAIGSNFNMWGDVIGKEIL